MKKNLVICPSKNRPEWCNYMYDSFLETSRCSDIIVVLDNNDKTLSKYKMGVEIQHPQNITMTFNKYWMMYRNKYQYFMCGNDDFVYHTENWDGKLLKAIEGVGGWGIAYGRNGLNDSIPMTSMISGNILDVIGYLQLPTLNHLYGDLVWRDFGNAINKLVYCKDVYIEHKHFMNLKNKKDKIYEKTNSDKNYKQDNAAYREWCKFEKERTARLVLSYMLKDSAV